MQCIPTSHSLLRHSLTPPTNKKEGSTLGIERLSIDKIKLLRTKRKWNRVCQHGVSAGPGDSAYRPRDIVRSFTSRSIHAPAPIEARSPTSSLRRSPQGSDSNSGWWFTCARAAGGGNVDRGYRGVSADCRRPINGAGVRTSDPPINNTQLKRT